jgi:hypothetical protein
VDFPEPESPMTTKTSPGATSKETSFTPTTQPVFFFISARLRSASGVPMIRSARGPKIFHNPCTDRAESVAGVSVERLGVTVSVMV